MENFDANVGLANANQAPRRLVLGMLLFLDGVEWLGCLGIRTTQPPLPSSDMGCPPIIEKHRTAL